VRLSVEERRAVQLAAEVRGEALGRFLAEAALDRAANVRRREARVGIPPRELLAVQVELREAARQIRAVGVNVNQVAAVANSVGTPPEHATAVLRWCARVLSTADAVLERAERLRDELTRDADL
jgi:uncharacterized protein (DUF1778 family)